MRELSEKTLKELDEYFQDVIVSQIPENQLKRKIAFKWIPKAENNILGCVYLFAAFLVVVLGLRGMGEDMPLNFLKDETGRLSSTVILIALGIEFVAILLLALTMMFKPEELHSLVHEFRKSGVKSKEDGINRIVKEILSAYGNINENTSTVEQLEKSVIVENGLKKIFNELKDGSK